jgi:hypothetical protein
VPFRTLSKNPVLLQALESTLFFKECKIPLFFWNVKGLGDNKVVNTIEDRDILAEYDEKSLVSANPWQ